jgi:hypothetical protein
MTEKCGNKTPIQLQSRNALNPTKFLQFFFKKRVLLLFFIIIIKFQLNLACTLLLSLKSPSYLQNLEISK